VVPLDSNDLHQIKKSMNPTKMKKRKRVKTPKEEQKKRLFDQDKINPPPEKLDEESRFGGMNMSNFKKNLGCGS
jgi:hypothetical protein